MELYNIYFEVVGKILLSPYKTFPTIIDVYIDLFKKYTFPSKPIINILREIKQSINSEK